MASFLPWTSEWVLVGCLGWSVGCLAGGVLSVDLMMTFNSFFPALFFLFLFSLCFHLQKDPSR